MTDAERIADLVRRIESLEQRVFSLDSMTPKLVTTKHYDWNSPSPYDLGGIARAEKRLKSKR